jgi:SWIM zinc finger
MTAETRQQRGLALFQEYASEIVEISPGVYRVPSCSGGGYFRVDLETGTCECVDYQYRGERCKHLYAVEIVAAKRRCRRQRTRRTGRRHSAP